MDWTFGTFLWSTILFFFWVMFIWMFIAVFADIIRRDVSGWAKAGWIALIVVLPFLGILIYLIRYPSFVGRRHTAAYADDGAPVASPADEIARAAGLHEQGVITLDEFERIKRRALSV